MTPRQLFDCAYVPTFQPFTLDIGDDYVKEQCSLNRRLAQSCTIPGTRKLHAYVPLSDSTMQVRHYSTSDTSRKERVSLAESDIPPELIAGFVTCSFDGWLVS